jgi:hypothetical protein
MRITVAILLLSFTIPSFGKDFRALDFGNDCRGVVEKERSMGSTFGSADEEGDLYTFTGLYEGWPVAIAYWCKGNSFRQGVYIFDHTTFAEATELYRVLKQRFSGSLGTPTYDFASPEHRRKMQSLGIEMRLSETYTCFWEANGTGVRLSMSGPHGGEGWQASINFEAIGKSNSNLENATNPSN